LSCALILCPTASRASRSLRQITSGGDLPPGRETIWTHRPSPAVPGPVQNSPKVTLISFW